MTRLKASPSLAGSPAFHPRSSKVQAPQPRMRADRYDHRGAYQHGAGVAPAPRSFGLGSGLDRQGIQHVVAKDAPSAVVAVADPYEPGKRILARVCLRVDILEDELKHRRITVSQYEIGRQVQAVFERATGAHISKDDAQTGGRIPDPSKRPVVRDAPMIRAVDNARAVKELMARIDAAVGPYGAQMLREILSGAGTFKAYAQKRDALASDRKISQVADRFRFLLEALDDSFAATGLTKRDADGNPMIYAETGEATGEETDARGRVVPAGHGYRWGR